MKCITLNLTKARKFARPALLILLCIVTVFLALIFTKRRIDEVDAQTASANEGAVIIIDAGHGGEDSGAVGVDGTLEKDLNLEIATQVGEMLAEKGFTVIYTRRDDSLVLLTDQDKTPGIRKISDLKNRVELTKEYPNALFVSIHMNTFGDGRYSGLQVFAKPDDKESTALAESIQKSVKECLQKDNNRQIKQGKDIFVLENANTDAVLIECGFLSNDEECKNLSQKEYQKSLSFAIVCGIMNYKEIS